MPAITDPERPDMRLPFKRVERAPGVLLWLLVSFPIAAAVFFASHFADFLRMPFRIVGSVYVLLVIYGILEYFKFEESITIDATSVHYKRTSVTDAVEWTERLQNYTGIAVITVSKAEPRPGVPVPPLRSHWSKRKADKLIRLISRDPKKSVTLWEFHPGDFTSTVNKKMHNFSGLLDKPVLPEQTA